MPEPRLALAILARDAERDLPAAIASARPFVDRVVVRDTGSSDGTADAARDLGAQVLRGAWHDDFAVARQGLLEACAADWVLMLDADERLERGGEQLRALTASPAAGFLAEIVSPTGFGRRERSWAPRLLNRAARPSFRHRAHEEVLAGGTFERSPLGLSHQGFLPSRRLAKSQRNLGLIDAELGQRPGDPWLLWWRGRELELLNRRREAEQAWEQMAASLCVLDAIDLARLDYAPAALGDWAEALAERGDARRALAPTTRLVLAHPRRPLARLTHARTLAAAGRDDDARSAARALLVLKGWRVLEPADEDALRTGAPDLLTRLGAGDALAAAAV